MLEISRLIAEVKERNGIRILPGDAGFVLVTLNQLVLEDLARQLGEGVRSGIADFNEVVQKTETRAGKHLGAICEKRSSRNSRRIAARHRERTNEGHGDRL